MEIFFEPTFANVFTSIKLCAFEVVQFPNCFALKDVRLFDFYTE